MALSALRFRLEELVDEELVEEELFEEELFIGLRFSVLRFRESPIDNLLQSKFSVN